MSSIKTTTTLGAFAGAFTSKRGGAVALRASISVIGTTAGSAMGSTVRSIRLMRADGDVIKCSREDHPDLFSLAMGGYGLFGLITDLELEMVPNVRLTPTYTRMSGRDLGKAFAEALAKDPKIQMAYGRLDVSLDRFFEDGMLITYRPSDDQTEIPAATGSGAISIPSSSRALASCAEALPMMPRSSASP